MSEGLGFLEFLVRTALEYKIVTGPILVGLFGTGFLALVNRRWAILGGMALATITFFGLLIMGK